MSIDGPVPAEPDFANTLRRNTLGMTLDHHVKFLAAAAGEKLVARGRTISAGRTVSVGAADVYAVRDGQETLCATALVTVRNVDRSRIQG